MILEGTIYCEAPGDDDEGRCGVHAHVGPDTMEEGRLPMGFVKVINYGGNGREHVNAFCSYDCAMKWMAKFPPPETIEFGESEKADG